MDLDGVLDIAKLDVLLELLALGVIAGDLDHKFLEDLLPRGIHLLVHNIELIGALHDRLPHATRVVERLGGHLLVPALNRRLPGLRASCQRRRPLLRRLPGRRPLLLLRLLGRRLSRFGLGILALRRIC